MTMTKTMEIMQKKCFCVWSKLEGWHDQTKTETKGGGAEVDDDGGKVDDDGLEVDYGGGMLEIDDSIL
jgi:hypothetical protein